MNLTPFSSGALLYGGVFTLKPGLHRSRALFVRAFDRLLRGKTPAREVLANAAYLQLDAKFLLNELSHRSSTPKAEVHLQLLRALVDDHALDGLFLGCAEHASVSSDSSPRSRPHVCPTASFEQIDRCSHCRVTQAGHRHNLHHFDALLVQPHDLLAPLVQLLQCLVSCVFFFASLEF